MLELDIKGDISIGNVQLTKARVLYLAKLVYNVGKTIMNFSLNPHKWVVQGGAT